MARTAGGRLRAHLAHAAVATADAAADLLAPPLRYGLVRTVAKVALRRDLPAVPAPAAPVAPVAPEQQHSARPRCVLLTNDLDTGGVEAVVDLLALALPGHGVDTEVICRAGGRTAEHLRGSGITVTEAADRAQTLLALQRRRPDVVQVHYAPAELIEAALEHDAPIVPVVHNTELFRSAEDWALQSRLAARAVATVAVSALVARQHRNNLTSQPRGEIVVIPNGVTPGVVGADRSLARDQVAACLDVDLGDDVLFLCLARCDQQKNIPGLVAGFLAAAERQAGLRLVIAGRVQDWLEYTKAVTLAASSPHGDRVHLLTTSDAPTLLAAADCFVLDSFFEGWPVAATEAAACGLPLVLPEVGGARELVGADQERGRMVTNAAGGPDQIDRRTIRQARRARVQSNRAELVDALLQVAGDIEGWRTRRPALTVAAMAAFDHTRTVEAHARLLAEAAGAAGGAPTSPMSDGVPAAPTGHAAR